MSINRYSTKFSTGRDGARIDNEDDQEAIRYLTKYSSSFRMTSKSRDPLLMWCDENEVQCRGGSGTGTGSTGRVSVRIQSETRQQQQRETLVK